MPRKKRSDCDEHAKMMKIIKSRLIEISLKVDKYIYKQKPITKVQAKAFLDEIALCKSHCQNDTGYLQVIEKLTKFMNVIISNNNSESAINGDTLSNGNVDASSNSTLTSINDNFSNPADKTSKNIRDSQNESQNATDNQKKLELTLSNESISGPKFENKKYASNKKYHNIVDERDSVKEILYIEKGGVINTPSNVKVSHLECNEPNLLQFENNIERNETYKDDDKASTNIDRTLQIKNNIQSALKKDCRFLICVERGVINEIALMQNFNVAVLQQASEVNIPLKEFVLNNTKMADTEPETRPNIKRNILKNLNEEAISISVIEKPGIAETNNKKVEFTAPYNDLAKMSISDEVINNKKLLSTPPLASSKQNNLPKKSRAQTKKNSAKNKKGNNAKKSEEITDKKIKRPAIKRKLKEPKNIFPKEVTPKTNDVNNKTDDLSWFDTIKYVRQVDEKEYFKPPNPLDDNFWCNPNLFLGDSKEFNI